MLVTGAAGFIGRNLTTYFLDHGYEVRGLVRSPEKTTGLFPGGNLYKGDLPHNVDASAFEGVETVIHCAYGTQFRSMKQATLDNEEATTTVIRLSRESKARRLIFMSSLSAHEQARSYYGRSKFALEKLFDEKHDLIIRAGLVIGGGEAGVFSRMVNPLKKFPFVPLLDGGRQTIQIVHIDDVCSAIHSALKENITGMLSLADPAGITLKEFLQRICEKLRKKRIFIPVPSTALLFCIKLLENMHFSTPISSENILGLKHLQFVDTTSDLARLHMKLLTPEESIDRIFTSD